jgi:hypothetical protein
MDSNPLVLYPPHDVQLQVLPSLIVNHERFDPIFLVSHPSDDSRGHIESLLSRQIHRERTHFPDSQRQIAGKPPTREREIPQGAVVLEQAVLVGHRATDREAAEGTKREGHGSLVWCRRRDLNPHTLAGARP